MMLGWLLARAGVTVVVLEKHRDFLRDFRGDTIHPSTLEVLHELGVLDEFLERPHREIRDITGRVGRETLTLGDFSHLPTRCKFIALMPQWDFLNFVASEARAHATFQPVDARARTVTHHQLQALGQWAAVEATWFAHSSTRGRTDSVVRGPKADAIDLGAPTLRERRRALERIFQRLSRKRQPPMNGSRTRKSPRVD